VWCSRSRGGPLGPGRQGTAIELLRRHLRAGAERAWRVSAVCEVEPGRGYAELERRYVVAGTSDERRETIFWGFATGAEWVLVSCGGAVSAPCVTYGLSKFKTQLEFFSRSVPFEVRTSVNRFASIVR